MSDELVFRQDRHVFNLCMGDQQTVKRIIVDQRQAPCPFPMRPGDIHLNAVGLCKDGRKSVRHLEFTEVAFAGDLPDGDGTDMDGPLGAL